MDLTMTKFSLPCMSLMKILSWTIHTVIVFFPLKLIDFPAINSSAQLFESTIFS